MPASPGGQLASRQVREEGASRRAQMREEEQEQFQEEETVLEQVEGKEGAQGAQE